MTTIRMTKKKKEKGKKKEIQFGRDFLGGDNWAK